jgi:hypothetical protein
MNQKSFFQACYRESGAPRASIRPTMRWRNRLRPYRTHSGGYRLTNVFRYLVARA